MPPTPLVTCKDCERAWYSTTLLDGLASLGSCPRCGGELVFHREPRVEVRDEPEPERFFRGEPHLVLGRPRGRMREDGSD